jgi:hypothetical protein
MISKLRWALLVCLSSALAQNGPLPEKETLYYNIEWRLITAGKARVQWLSVPNSGWQVNLHLDSAGLVSKLYRVDDDYSANLTPGLCAQLARLTTHEGNRDRETRITFDNASHRANYVERDRARNAVVLARETEIPSCTHEVAGGLYFLRTLNLEPGQSTQVAVTDGKKSVTARVEAQQREDVRTPAGSFKTIRYEAHLFDNVLYRRPAHLYVWLTDDRRKLPVQIRVKMQLAIGSITLQLEKME